MAETTPSHLGATIAQATVYNGAAPGANTNILSTGITFGANASACRVTVCLGTSSVFNVYVTDGTNAFTMGLNESNALQAGDLYTFTFGVRKVSSQTGSTTLTYNFRVETDGVINYLLAEEVRGPVL